MTLTISLFVAAVGLAVHYLTGGKTQALGIPTFVVGLFWLVSTLSHVSLSIR